MEQKIVCQFDNVGYPSKPKGQEGLIKSRLRKERVKEYSFDEVIKMIETGHTLYPAIADGIKAADWKGQMLFCVDIDNEFNDIQMLTIEDSFNICKKYKIKPIAIYETYSSTPEHPKFRILFLCNEVINDNNKRSIIVKTLIRLFPQADPVCTNADRMFLGTNKKFSYIDENSTFSYDDIIRINGEFPLVEKSKVEVANKERNKNGIDLFDEISKYDFFLF